VSAQASLVRAAGPEFELMCLAARIAFGSDEAERIGRLVGEGIEWTAFLAGVERNFVAPVVSRNLLSIDGSGIPSKVLETLRVRSKITAFKNELFATELARLSQVFESKSIQIINYKGAAAAEEYYGSVALRNFNDLDFLVRREDLAALCEVLESQGYGISEQLTREQFDHSVMEFKEFLFKRGEICLEPHWSLTGRRYPFEMDYEGFWQRSRTLKFRGVDLRVMSDEDSLLVLCLVGAKGQWKRLQMATDVAACARTFPNLDWASVAAVAAATGTVRILHLGLLLAADLAGAQLPTNVDQEVRKTPAVRKLARDVVKSLAGPRAPPRFLPDSPAIFALRLFRQRERFRDRWLYFWRTTTTPERLHLTRLPLPKLGSPLYRILVPLHDFVMYPAWKLGKTMLTRSRR
jgi:hypothetical protein